MVQINSMLTNSKAAGNFGPNGEMSAAPHTSERQNSRKKNFSNA
jgi:hypothetical protein